MADAAKKWKPDVTPGDLAGAMFFNTLFLTLAVADYSADLWAAAAERDVRVPFLVQYVAWRQMMPVIGTMLLVLLCLLPFVLFGMVSGALQGIFGWRRATSVRNAMDCAEVAGIMGIVFTIFTRAAPATEAFVAACPPKARAVEACTLALDSMTDVHLAFVFLNLVMFLAPIVKFAYGNAGQARLEGIMAKQD